MSMKTILIFNIIIWANIFTKIYPYFYNDLLDVVQKRYCLSLNAFQQLVFLNCGESDYAKSEEYGRYRNLIIAFVVIFQ